MSLPIRFVADVWSTGQPGDAEYSYRGGLIPVALNIRCPGCGGLICLYVNPPIDDYSSWDWNGNIELPTLRPSIRHADCGWRGQLTGGVFLS